MTVFLLETESVNSSASKVNKLSTDLNTLKGTVSGWNTSCEDGFNFAGAKNVIASNISKASTKVKNTYTIMDKVVTKHTELQNSLKFAYDDGTGSEVPATDDGGATTPTPTTPTGGATNNIGTNDTGNYGGNVTGGGGGGGGGGNYSGGYVDPGDGASGTPVPTPTTPTESKIGEVKTKLNTVGFGTIDESKLTDETKNILNDKDFKYSEEGFAKIGNRYIIACDSSIGDVGDVIRFTKNDGTVIECIIGMVTTVSAYENSLIFVVDKDKLSTLQKNTKLTDLLIKDNKIVENLGNYKNLDESPKIISLEKEAGLTASDDKDVKNNGSQGDADGKNNNGTSVDSDESDSKKDEGKYTEAAGDGEKADGYTLDEKNNNNGEKSNNGTQVDLNNDVKNVNQNTGKEDHTSADEKLENAMTTHDLDETDSKNDDALYSLARDAVNDNGLYTLADQATDESEKSNHAPGIDLADGEVDVYNSPDDKIYYRNDS